MARTAVGESQNSKILSREFLSGLSPEEFEAESGKIRALPPVENNDDAIIAHNMEKSRQVAHYKPLYAGAALLALVIVLIAMFVDYHLANLSV